MTDDLERRFLLVKRGLYYAPDNHGYTGIKERAGRYLESDAGPDSGVTAIHEDEAPDYSPACFHDTAREHLQGKIARLRAENEALREALRRIARSEYSPYIHSPWDEARRALQEGSRHE